MDKIYQTGKKIEQKLQDQEDWLKTNSIEKFYQHDHWKYDKGIAASNCKTLLIANNLTVLPIVEYSVTNKVDLRFSNPPRGYSTLLDLAMV